jgi:4'-phosphopantetheinyl transferase
MGSTQKIQIPKSEIRNQILYPVILPVPEAVGGFKPRDRAAFLSAHARKALSLCARKTGVTPGEFRKDADGVPVPVDGIYWSLTHKTDYVAGVLSSQPVGIDLEKIQPCSPGLYSKTASQAEWDLAHQSSNDFTLFYRYWTSKEAVVKVSTAGIKDLLKCRIHKIIDDHHLEIAYLDQRWQIEQFYFDDHVASVVRNDFTVEWTIG